MFIVQSFKRKVIIIKNRQLEIILYLNKKNNCTIAELSKEFEVSKRTIMRDLDFLSSLGIPVYTKSGYNGGVYLDENYIFNQSFFTSSEINDSVLALHIADSLSGGIHKNSIIKKLELLLPEITLTKENDFLEYVKVEPLLKDFDVNSPLIKAINYALDEEVYLLITCYSRRYMVAPLYYSIGANGISLCASCNREKLFFSICEIKEYKITDIEFNREDFI